MYATFDLGLIGYWAVPTAPPWYAAAHGPWTTAARPSCAAMMYEYGEQFWKSGWQPLYGFLGGNPLAAMPSLHFATSVMAAHLLSEVGRASGRARLGLRRDARVSRSSTSASTTWSTSSPGSRSPRSCGRRARRAGPAAAGGAVARLAAQASRASNNPGQGVRPWRRGTGSRPAPAAQPGGRGRRRDDERGRPAASTSPPRGVGVLRPLRRIASIAALLLPAAAARGPRRHLAPDRGGRPVVARARPAVHGRDVRGLRHALPGRLRARRIAADLAGELPDHHGRARRHAAVLGGRRGRARAHRVGAAALGHGPADGGRPDDLLPRPAVPHLHGRDDRLRLRAALRPLPRATRRSR